MTLEQLKILMDSGEFHHATYRDHGTIWEGLRIYVKFKTGFRGYAPHGVFGKDDPNLAEAENMVRNTGVSVGAYGEG